MSVPSLVSMIRRGPTSGSGSGAGVTVREVTVLRLGELRVEDFRFVSGSETSRGSSPVLFSSTTAASVSFGFETFGAGVLRGAGLRARAFLGGVGFTVAVSAGFSTLETAADSVGLTSGVGSGVAVEATSVGAGSGS